MTYRNPDLLALARVAPHCMCCARPNGGNVVSAHSNQSRDGKGMGLKASDAAICFACDICHTFIDQGVFPGAGVFPNGAREAMWERGHRATMRWLIENGHLIVSLESRREDPPARVARKLPRRRRPIPKGPPLKSRSTFPSRKDTRHDR